MQIMIEIPEEEYNECKMQVEMIKQESFLNESLNTALKIHVANGTPIPEKCDDKTWTDAYRKGYHRAMLDYGLEDDEEQKWIPVSEKKPKENGWYQCTVILNDLPRTMELFYKNGKWLDNRRINMFDTYDIYGYGNTKEKHKLSYQELISEFDWTENVIAWTPLSEPYKAESGEQA